MFLLLISGEKGKSHDRATQNLSRIASLSYGFILSFKIILVALKYRWRKVNVAEIVSVHDKMICIFGGLFD